MNSKRATKAIIYTKNLRTNLEELRRLIGPKVKMCVAVKADGYGHNAYLTAKTAEETGAEYLAIATVDEGIELREKGIKAQLLLLSLCTPEEYENLFNFNITPLVFGEDYIKLVSKAACEYAKGGNQKYPVFLAVDSGMGRIGCYESEAGNQAKLISDSKNLKLAGMITHFAVSDSLSKEHVDYTKEQFNTFMKAIDNVKALGIDPGIRTCANSAATLNNPEMYLDMVRPGIITYGYYPDEVTKDFLAKKNIKLDIKPVMALETKVVAIRHFPAEKSVSYGRTWKTCEETDIAVLPVGYADGLLRRFSPGLQVTINGKNYPVRGRICMDQCMVELGKNHDVKLFDKVEIFGPAESGALNTADDLAELGKTISYEVLTSISKRVERQFV